MFLPDHTREGERKMDMKILLCDKAKHLQEVLVEGPLASFEKEDYNNWKKNLWEELRCDLEVVSVKTAGTE